MRAMAETRLTAPPTLTRGPSPRMTPKLSNAISIAGPVADRPCVIARILYGAGCAVVPFFRFPKKGEWSAGRRQGAWRSALWRALTEPAARPRQEPGYPGLPLRGRAPPLTEGAAPPGAPLFGAHCRRTAPCSAIATSLEMTRDANKADAH